MRFAIRVSGAAPAWAVVVILMTAGGPVEGQDRSREREPRARAQRAEATLAPTREFEIRADRAFLGGREVDLWGIRAGNALMTDTITERYINNFDNMVAHGINLIGFYIHGSNGGYPDENAGVNGFTRDGHLKPSTARRLDWLVREADKRGMVVMVGLFSPRKDQEFYDEDAIRQAVQETGRFLVERKLKNVFIDIMHEYNHEERIDHAIFREPDGAAKKAKLTAWFKEVAPDIEVGVCPTYKSNTRDRYPGMDVRIIQKEAEIPSEGFVVNVELHKQDAYENDGWFNPGHKASVFADCERYLKAPNAVMLFHSGYSMGITNVSRTAPHAEMGGYGDGASDRGIRFYYDWVRNHVGRWEYPKHVLVPPVKEEIAIVATREFEIRGDLSYLGGKPVKLWGVRCNNALMSPAVTERHVRALNTMVAHGINMIGVGLQGTNGGFPNVDAGPNAFRSDGTLRPEFAKRLEWLIRESDKRGMVVVVYVLQPRKDQELRDEKAVQRAIEQTGEFLSKHKLKNVFVNLMHEFDQPERVDHDILREPDGPTKKARLMSWFKAVAPDIEAGICPNHRTNSSVEFPGIEVRFFQEEKPIPPSGFVVNAETDDHDEPGNDGIFNMFHLEAMNKEWHQYLSLPRAALLFHSAYGEGITTATGTGPNPEPGGYGTGEKDRGVRFYYDWILENVGRWEYPIHVKTMTIADEEPRTH